MKAHTVFVHPDYPIQVIHYPRDGQRPIGLGLTIEDAEALWSDLMEAVVHARANRKWESKL